MADEYMVTTSDNPFNYFTQFEAWLAYDMRLGHHTLNYLARVARTSHELSEEDTRLAISQAVDEIVRMNINGLYVKQKAPNPE